MGMLRGLFDYRTRPSASLDNEALGDLEITDDSSVVWQGRAAQVTTAQGVQIVRLIDLPMQQSNGLRAEEVPSSVYEEIGLHPLADEGPVTVEGWFFLHPETKAWTGPFASYDLLLAEQANLPV